MLDKTDIILSALQSQFDGENKNIDLDTRIDDLELDSLKFMLFIIDLQDESNNLIVDVKKVGSVETVRDLANIVSFINQ